MTLADDIATLERLLADRTMTLAECEAVARVKAAAERCAEYEDFDFKIKSHMGPHSFIQWKGTDVCVDLYCKCGAHSHFDGLFLYHWQCPHCKAVWQMGTNIAMRSSNEKPGQYSCVQHPDMDPEDAPSPDGGG